MERALRELDGRWLTALVVAFYFGAVAVANAFFHVPLWTLLGVPTLPEPFHDLRDIATGIERFQTSDHPWSEETIVYATGAYNYTKWWLLGGWLGLGPGTVYPFGWGLDMLFFACALFVLGRLAWTEGFVAGLVLISPSVMTAVERANADIVIFILMALVIALRRSTPLSTALVTFAAFLKIYPIAALLALVRPPLRKNLPWLLVALALFAIDLLTSRGELHQISTNVTRVGWFSYGSTTFMEGYWQTTTTGTGASYGEMFVIGSVLYLFVVGWAIRKRPRFELDPTAERRVFMFRIGAALFIGTFALGSNLDYRTIMLIFCLPLLFVLRTKPGAGTWAFAAIVSIVLYTYDRLLWDDAIPFFFFLKQFISWLMVFLLAGIFASTVELAAGDKTVVR